MSIANKKCVPCEGGTKPLSQEQEDQLLKEIPQWTILKDGVHTISRTFTFKNFNQAMAFANAIAVIADQEGHHPDMCISWAKVKVSLTTHAIKGLSENDFIIAAKIDNLYIS